MALHNPVLEAAARIQFALKRGEYVTLDGCRRYCAENQEQALKAVETAAALIDDLRHHNLLPPAAPKTGDKP